MTTYNGSLYVFLNIFLIDFVDSPFPPKPTFDFVIFFCYCVFFCSFIDFYSYFNLFFCQPY